MPVCGVATWPFIFGEVELLQRQSLQWENYNRKALLTGGLLRDCGHCRFLQGLAAKPSKPSLTVPYWLEEKSTIDLPVTQNGEANNRRSSLLRP